RATRPAPAFRRARSSRAPSPTIPDSGPSARGAAPGSRGCAPRPAPRTCPRRTLGWKSATSAEDGFEPRGERAGAERLSEKIVRAELEDAHFVVFVALRRQHDDGNVRGRGTRPQVRQHAIAVETGQIQVEHDDVGTHAIDLIERLHAVACFGDDVAVALEQVTHDFAQAVLIVDE